MTKRNMNYRRKSLEELLEAYAFENGRNNKEDAKITKQLIVNEVYARIKDTFERLDSASTDAEMKNIYKQLIEH